MIGEDAKAANRDEHCKAELIGLAAAFSAHKSPPRRLPQSEGENRAEDDHVDGQGEGVAEVARGATDGAPDHG